MFKKFFKGMFYLVAGFIGFIVLLMIFDPTDQQSDVPDVIGYMTTTDVRTQTVAQNLKNPESAKFRGVFLTDKDVVCGEVTGKNSFGVYPGYKKFVATPVLTAIEGTMNPKNFAYLWNTKCYNATVVYRKK